MKNYRSTFTTLVCAAGLALAGALPVYASGGGKTFAEGVNYIAITPPLIVNYGGPGKARFIKAELSLRVENAVDAAEVTHHLPLIRDRLISILSEQTEEVISTAEGKEQLRLFALDEINKALHAVEGHAEHGPDDAHAKDDKHDDKADGHAKDEKAKDDKVKDHDKKDEDKKAAGDHAETKGPASDLFFNNFVVQK